MTDQQAPEQLHHLSLDSLQESPTNPRRTHTDTDLQELAASIRADGVLLPILARPRWHAAYRLGDDPPDFYEIVCGHRRVRAARLAGLPAVPTRVRYMSDTEVARAQIAENLARKDVHPIEEAEGMQALIDDHGMTADQIAEQLGKSRTVVYSALKLTRLCKEVRDACLAGEIGKEVAILIARVGNDKMQAKALGYIRGKYLDLGDGGSKSFRSIRALLNERFNLDLTRAIFDTAADDLLPAAPSCAACPKRSGNAPEFADIVEAQEGGYGQTWLRTRGADVCTDPDCFEAKKRAHLKAEAEALRAAGKVVIDGNKARAAIDAGGNLKGGYVPLAKVRGALAKARKSNKGAPAPQVVSIQDPRTGKVVEAVRAEQVQAAGVPHGAGAAPGTLERERREAELAAEKARRLRLLAALRTTMYALPRDAFDLTWVAAIAASSRDRVETDVLNEMHGLELRPWADVERAREAIAKCPPEQLTRLILDSLLVAELEPGWNNDEPSILTAFADHYGVPLTVEELDAYEAARVASPPASAARARKKARGNAANTADAEPTDDPAGAGAADTHTLPLELEGGSMHPELDGRRPSAEEVMDDAAGFADGEHAGAQA